MLVTVTLDVRRTYAGISEDMDILRVGSPRDSDIKDDDEIRFHHTHFSLNYVDTHAGMMILIKR